MTKIITLTSTKRCNLIALRDKDIETEALCVREFIGDQHVFAENIVGILGCHRCVSFKVESAHVTHFASLVYNTFRRTGDKVNENGPDRTKKSCVLHEIIPHFFCILWLIYSRPNIFFERVILLRGSEKYENVRCTVTLDSQLHLMPRPIECI